MIFLRFGFCSYSFGNKDRRALVAAFYFCPSPDLLDCYRLRDSNPHKCHVDDQSTRGMINPAHATKPSVSPLYQLSYTGPLLGTKPVLLIVITGPFPVSVTILQ